jgi:hypothetical protein
LPPGAPACAPNCPHFASCVSGASNEHILDEIGARGAAPRRLQCAIDDDCTLTCTLLRFSIQKLCRYWADRATEWSLASKPMRGDKMRVFPRLCARFLGWLPMLFVAGKRFGGFVLQPFRQISRAGICTHIAGQAAYIGDKTRQKNSLRAYPKVRTDLREGVWRQCARRFVIVYQATGKHQSTFFLSTRSLSRLFLPPLALSLSLLSRFLFRTHSMYISLLPPFLALAPLASPLVLRRVPLGPEVRCYVTLSPFFRV